MKESVVEIPPGSGNHYRYEYNPATGATEYRGPVGDAPALAEPEFNVLMQARSGRQIYDMTLREGKGSWVPSFKPDGRQLYETRLLVLDLRPWGYESPGDIIRMVNKAGYENFGIAKTNGEWHFIIKEWKVRRF